MISTLLISFSISVFGWGADHGIYISVIVVDESTVFIKVFSDDLRDAIRNYSDDSLEPDNSQFLTTKSKLIANYFNERCELKINGERQSLEYESARTEGDATFLYFSFENDSNWSHFSLKADYFMELFSNQSNVLTVKYQGSQYFDRLQKSKSSFSFTRD
ncbi:MAG: DUF6702 family protein [Ekhidna sp.]